MRLRKVYQVKQIGVRLPEDTLAWLEQRADQERLPPSTLVRVWIEAEAKRDLLQKDRGNGGLRDSTQS